jgi:hypothetical protein
MFGIGWGEILVAALRSEIDLAGLDRPRPAAPPAAPEPAPPIAESPDSRA